MCHATCGTYEIRRAIVASRPLETPVYKSVFCVPSVVRTHKFDGDGLVCWNDSPLRTSEKSDRISATRKGGLCKKLDPLS
jgi:hypothetical protein